MRRIIPILLEQGRLRDNGPFHSETGDLHGAFFVVGPMTRMLKIISSGSDREYNWEHVSVSLENRTPVWDEMCFVKNLFWREDECVVQYHPPKSEYVNHHPYCLHLWRPMNVGFPLPPSILVGPKNEASQDK
jgi:hypothetical protein